MHPVESKPPGAEHEPAPVWRYAALPHDGGVAKIGDQPFFPAIHVIGIEAGRRFTRPHEQEGILGQGVYLTLSRWFATATTASSSGRASSSASAPAAAAGEIPGHCRDPQHSMRGHDDIIPW